MAAAVSTPFALRAATPDLSGEALWHAFGTQTAGSDVSASCDNPSTTTSFSYALPLPDGGEGMLWSGPYQGTFRASGTVAIGPQTLPSVGFFPAFPPYGGYFAGSRDEPTGTLISLTTAFVIDSPAGHVAGTQTLLPPVFGTDGWGACRDLAGRTDAGGLIASGTIRSASATLSYEATITTPAGVFHDHGTSRYYFEEYTVNYASGGGGIGGNFDFTFESAGSTPVDQPSPSASDPFIRRSGTQLLLNGQPYQFNGVNIYNANSDDWCGYGYTNAELGAALDKVGPNGVVRAWFFQSQAALKSPGGAHLWSGARDWTRFDTLLLLAQQKGLRVIVTLTDQWGECGDGPSAGYKADTWYGGPPVGGSRDSSQAGYKVADLLESAVRPAHGYDHWVSYRDWVQEVVGRYADHPEILAWQLINEGEAKTAGNGNCPTDATAVMTAWADDVSTMIRNLDPNHLISLGTLGTGQCGTAGAGYSTLHALPNIDLCEFHDYGPETLPAALQTHINECNSLHKPIFVGEVGIKPADAGGTLAGRRDLFAAKIAAQSSAGVSGILAWLYNQRFPEYLLDSSPIGTRNPANYFDIGPCDPALLTLAAVPANVPCAPRAVTAAAGGTSVSIAWLEPWGDGGNPIAQYVVTSSPGGISATTGGLITSATLTGLSPGTPYTFTVTATNAVGSGPGAVSGTVTLVPGAPPPQTTIATIPSTGGTVATDLSGSVPTASNPLITTVSVPAGSGGGVVTIAETTVSGPPPAGYVFLAGQQVLITSTAATSVSNPLSIVFRFDPSLAPTVFRNGVAVLTTCNPAGTATPTPCISSTGPGTITILTVQASTWNVGRVTPASLCALTYQFVQGSAKYQALSVKLRATIDALVSAACKSLDAITAKLTAKQKTALIAAYKSGVGALVQSGWLTQTQATQLRALTDAL